ncbi:39S ribosomal protein L44, mitochondrial [Condylostylus longicornis]|uniref:39S ribosomal protein L44, mitochondrial n=1 Tax=Condylostylus longicornis TaxID=2530218 RepID=UPI00244DAFC1|nr:39S ribosomal protein L44, mitochondrial [Condylostylus longicornis]
MFQLQSKMKFFKQIHCLIITRAFSVNTPNFTKRWVAPTLRELRHRRNKFKSDVFTARNTFLEWNYNAEIFAFGKRLNEDFNMKHLQVAFIDISYTNQEQHRQTTLEFDPPLNMQNNRELVEIGEKCISDYVQSYLQFSLPKCPQEGIIKIFKWLTSEEMLSNISLNIGTKDLTLCAENCPSQKVLRDVFVAVIGALSKSADDRKVYNFVRDFICTQLNQKDLSEIMNFDNAFEELKTVCKKREIGEPTPRLLAQNAAKTVLATNYVGVYGNQKLLGKGFGESINIAIEAASIDALCKIYGIQYNRKTFSFDLQS